MVTSVYPPFALLAGMQLDLFTALEEGPMKAEQIAAKIGVGDRVKVVAADAVRDPLSGSYDVAVMSAFLQVLSPDDARFAIKNVSKVMKSGGEIYIRGYGIIDNSRTSPRNLVGFNLVFINVYDEGQAYTEQEHKGWLEEAGFDSFKRHILEDGSSIITARKIKWGDAPQDDLSSAWLGCFEYANFWVTLSLTFFKF